MTRTLVTSTILLSSALAYAGDPAPPAGGAPVPAAPAAPADPAKPADPAAPVPEKDAACETNPCDKGTDKKVTITPAPTGALDTRPTPGAVLSSTTDDGGVRASSDGAGGRARSPRIALELSGAGAGIANQFVEYKGWTFENGAPKGFRFEANLIGIQLAYELSSMANEQACAATCLTGSFGSTTAHSIELGYRFRFSQIGPVRPFVAASIGGVLASGGDWWGSTKGGSGRAGVGIEVPIMDRFFASATVAYRILVVENPLRNADAEKADKVLLMTDVPNGDYAEDLHVVAGYVGFGVSL